MSLEKLTLLNPKSVDFNGSGGGLPSITSADILTACGMLSNRHADMVLYVVLGYQWGDDVWQWTFNRFRHHGVKNNRIIDVLAASALRELRDPKVCRACYGVGFHIHHRKGVVCEVCHGAGHLDWSSRDRVHGNVSYKSAQRYKSQYEEVMLDLRQLLGQAGGEFYKVINDD